MQLRSDFVINEAKFQKYSEIATDWLVRSFNFKYGSDEWTICRLKHRIYHKKSLYYLKEAQKELALSFN
jgi:hypothetical protein